MGSYNSTSLGDHAILEGIARLVGAGTEHVSLVVFSREPTATMRMLQLPARVLPSSPLRATSRCVDENQPAKSPFEEKGACDPPEAELLLPYWRPRLWWWLRPTYRACRLLARDIRVVAHLGFWHRVWTELHNSDVLLIGGGNLLMDFVRSWPIYPLVYVVLAKLARVPVVFFAVGAGPVATRRGRAYLRIACRLADRVLLRDEESMSVAQGVLQSPADKTLLSADPAVCLRSKKRTDAGRCWRRPMIAMTVVPYCYAGLWPSQDTSAYSCYVRSMAHVCDCVIKRLGGEVTLFATNYPKDLIAARDVYYQASCQSQITVLEERHTVAGIVDLLSSSDILIGTRLHSLVLSLVSNTPFLGISYQPKVASFCRRIGLERYVIPLSKDGGCCTEQVLTLVGTLLGEDREIRAHLRSQLRELRNSARAGLDSVMELIHGASGT